MGRTLKSGKYLKGRVKTDLRLQDIWDLSEKGIVGKEKVYAGTGMHQMYTGDGFCKARKVLYSKHCSIRKGRWDGNGL